ncbi:IclR family transcriptional regulator [Fictibacillus sp. B-59209]|uniref:IclR family transcriptional regulator n=1 Tax=Fictibacillus sp. B-59209 TaxID=3024873 RepID=UPI002E1A6652|nr:IclR family transcriptional regulator [Fictibacillus sp. B-59209]
MNKSSKNGSVEKALNILEFFNERDPFYTLQQLSTETGYPKTTLFRLLCSLEKFGYVRRIIKNGEILFALGWSFLEKAALVKDQINLKELARDEMISLRNKTNLSVQLALQDGKEAIYIEQIPSFQPIRIYPEIGKRVPLYSAACPRVLLAYLSHREQEGILSDSISNNLHQELVHIREKGFAVSKGELAEGTMAMAVPIFDGQEDIIASLSVIGLEHDPIFKDTKEVINNLKTASEAISTKLQG